MANKSMAYDHPTYLVPQSVGGTIGATASSQFRFASWTTMILKSVQISNIVAGTGGDTDAFVLQRVNLDPTLGTATTSLAQLGTNTANFSSRNVQGTYTFTAGELISVMKGTDGTSQYAVALELYVSPGANVTG